MKKTGTIAVAALLVCTLAVRTFHAQQPQRSSDDQKIEELKKRQAELKRQIREELERQNKALEEELSRLRSERLSATPAPPSNPTVTTPGSVTSIAEPGPPTSSLGSNSTSSHPGPAVTNSGTDNTMSVPAPVSETTSNAMSGGGNGSANSVATPSAVSQSTSCALILADPKKFSRADQSVCFLARTIINRRMAGVGSTGIDPTTEDMTFLLPAVLAQIIRVTPNLSIDAALKSFVVDVEASRSDKQFGSDPKSSGTTSLGVKGGIPQVLSWAVENGGAVASTDGTSVTFRVNPVGFVEALSSRGYISAFREAEDDALARFFRRTSVGFSFDTTRGTDPPTFIGSKQQLSAVSFRYQFVNQRDPRAEAYREKWDNFIRTQGVALTDLQTEELMKLQLSTVAGGFRNPALQKWLDSANASVTGTTIPLLDKNAAIDQLRQILTAQLGKLPASELEADTEVRGALMKFVGAYIPYLTEKKKIMDQIARGTVATFEYTNFREPNAPDLSNLRFILEKGTLGGVDITANASLTFFNKLPVGPNIQRIRDFDFSAQLDKRLDDVMGLGNATLSFTGKFQRLTSDAVAFDGTVLPNTRGDIAAGQVKLTIPIKDSGIKIPIAFTFANRTELVREREVRGNFGFTFDLDTLFAKFKSFNFSQ